MMNTAKVVLQIFFAFIGSNYLNLSVAQESLPLTSPGADQSRSTSTPIDSKQQFRTWQAQYRAMQGMMREEQNRWTGYNPQRPVVSSGEAYSVPYSNLVYPFSPIGRTIYYRGGSAFHY